MTHMEKIQVYLRSEELDALPQRLMKWIEAGDSADCTSRAKLVPRSFRSDGLVTLGTRGANMTDTLQASAPVSRDQQPLIGPVNTSEWVETTSDTKRRELSRPSMRSLRPPKGRFAAGFDYARLRDNRRCRYCIEKRGLAPLALQPLEVAIAAAKVDSR
jgi:hypothetical protein